MQDLLDTPNTTASNVAGTLIPAPSPRRTTQSPETHRLQQALRNNATDQVFWLRLCQFYELQRSGNTPSAFSTFGANDCPITVETVNENSDGSDEWLEDGRLAGNAASDDVQINLAPSASKANDSADKVQVDFIRTGSGYFPRRSRTSNEAGMAYDASMTMGVASTSPHAGKNLVISTIDPGQADFAMTVGSLGNASGTPLDGSHNMSFGEDGSESNTSVRTPPNYDQCNPEAIGDLLSRPPKPMNHSPVLTIKFNEQTVVTEYTQHGCLLYTSPSPRD